MDNKENLKKKNTKDTKDKNKIRKNRVREIGIENTKKYLLESFIIISFEIQKKISKYFGNPKRNKTKNRIKEILKISISKH